MYWFIIIYTYIKNFFNKFKLNNYYYLDYNSKEDLVKKKNITFWIYLLNIFNLRNNIYIINLIYKFININLNSPIIKINKNGNILLEQNKVINSIVPKGIVSNIIIDVKNHRYNLNNLKKNLFKIDKDIPLIFCLIYYENIYKIEDIFIGINYFGKENVNFNKIGYLDKTSILFDNI